LTQVRTSERSSFKRCRFAWDIAFNKNLRPVRTAPALRFGTLVHQAMELRYPVGRKRGPLPHRSFMKLFDAEVELNGPMLMKLGDDGFEEWHSARDVGVHILEEFIDEFGDDERFEVLATEQVFQTPVLSPGGELVFTYVGTLDGVWRDLEHRGRLLIHDWKTAGRISTAHLAVDDQASAYLTFAAQWLRAQHIIPAKADLSRMMYTYIRKAEPDDRPRDANGSYLNKDGSVSKRQPPPLFHREWVYRGKHTHELVRERAIQEFREMQMVRAGELAVLKSANSFACGNCGFRAPCEAHEIGADFGSVLDSLFEPWDPYSDHEVREEGR
jgi:PD-(D/E)XK nuclease superfamily